MSCAPCKVLLLRLARHIEGEDKATMTTERLHERKKGVLKWNQNG